MIDMRSLKSIHVETGTGLLRRELEKNEAVYNSHEPTREQIRFMNSLTAIVDTLDPLYNGWDDTNLADQWYLAENLSDCDMIQHRKELIDVLLRYGRAKVVTLSQCSQHYSHPWERCYNVMRIPEDIRKSLHKELMILSKKTEDQITPEDLRYVYGIVPLIDAIDVQFPGVVRNDLIVSGLSIRERWELARYVDFSTDLPKTPEEYNKVYDRYLAILQGSVRYGVAKIYLGEGVSIEEVPLEERVRWLLEGVTYRC